MPATAIEREVFESMGRRLLDASFEERDAIFLLRIAPVWRTLSEREAWLLLRQLVWCVRVTRRGEVADVSLDTVMIDVLAAEEPEFFADLPPRSDEGRLDRVTKHALLRMRALGTFGPRGYVSDRDDELEEWIDLDYAAGRAAMRGTRRLRDDGFLLGPVLARMRERRGG